MKRFTEIFRIVFTAALLSSALCVYAQVPNPESDFRVGLNSTNDGVVITGYTGSRTDLVIPEEIQGFPVVELGANSFRRARITSVVFPSTLVTIQESAFEASSITSVYLRNGLLLGQSVFRNCTQLTTVEIEEGRRAIPYNTFYGCTNLASITLPNSLEAIRNMAFSGTSSLTSITIPGNVKQIERFAFSSSGLVTLIISEGVERIGQEAFRGSRNGGQLVSVTLPSTITEIGDSAFTGNPALTELIIPESITRISFEINVFNGASNLPLRTQARLRELGYRGNF